MVLIFATLCGVAYIIGYYGFKFAEFKRQRVRLVAASEKPSNVFREMAIDELSSYTLIYIPETGIYERRREIR